MASKKKQSKSRPPVDGFVTEFVHWRTRKLMKAADYGYKAWPLGRRRKG